MIVGAVDGVLVVAGELDHARAEDFMAAVERVCPPGQPVVLDMAEVTFLASAGLRALVRLRQRAGGTPAAVTLLRPHARVVRVLQLLELDGYFRLEDADGSAGAAG
jgi:anti-sigma B factor antagonist